MENKHYFLNRTDQTEQPEYTRLCEYLYNNFPVGWDNKIENFSFVMLKPNAYLSNSIPEIITQLHLNNIEIMEYKLIMLSEEHLNNLYCFIKNKYANSWWVMQKVYSLAPCLVAIVQGEKCGFNHLSSRIRSLVGNTTPIISNDNSIRYAPYSMTRIFNTIHATDDPASAIREAMVFFSKETILNIFQNHGMQKTNAAISDPQNQLTYNPDIVSFGGLKHDIKNCLIEKASELMGKTENKEYSPVMDSLNQIKSLLLEEKLIIEQLLPLREEFYRLSPILNLERFCLTFIERSIETNIRNLYRDPQLQSDQSLVQVFTKIRNLAKLIYPLTDDAIFFSIQDFEMYLAEINSSAFNLTAYQQTVLLGCWAGAFEEMRDISTKWPVKEIKR
ncbi:MAG: nucleoside-diphosphate kinase [Chloroflexi bacterium]|nr:nucleoside-diphosphate kinase [Chloroflexota bacterium]